MRQDWKVSRREASAALALFRRRQWLLALIGVVALTVAFVFLGRWQMQRHEAKVARRDLVNANYDARPGQLADVLSQGRALPSGDQWRPVSASGTYLTEHTLLVRNRLSDAGNGYEVMVPLRTAAGVLLVDRGWIPAGSDASKPNSVPSAPTGTVTVVVRLRPGEPPEGRAAPAGQVLRIDLPQIEGILRAGGVEEPIFGAYGVLARETPAVATAPRLLPRPDVGLGINLAYALQWWAFAIAGYVLLAVAAVREVRRGAAVHGADAPRPVPAARSAT